MEENSRVTQLQLLQHRGQPRRNLDGRDSQMGSGALCSSGSAVTLLETSSAAAQSCHQGVTLPSPPRSEGTLTPALKTASSPGRPRTGCSEASLISCQGASQSGEGGVGESRGQESAAHFREEEAEVRTGLGSPSRTFSTCITIPGRRGHLLSTPVPIGM